MLKVRQELYQKHQIRKKAQQGVFKISGSGNSRGDFGGTVGTGIQW